MSLKFREDGAFIGASIEKYLLEKSRIVYQAPRERYTQLVLSIEVLVSLCRNYHVFYYLLAGADDVLRRKLWLKNPEYFHFLNQVIFEERDRDFAIVFFFFLRVACIYQRKRNRRISRCSSNRWKKSASLPKYKNGN